MDDEIVKEALATLVYYFEQKNAASVGRPRRIKDKVDRDARYVARAILDAAEVDNPNGRIQ